MNFKNKILYVFTFFITCFSFCKSMEKNDIFEKISDSDMIKIEKISDDFVDDKIGGLKKLVEECPNVAKQIMLQNKHFLLNFEEYCEGITADEHLSLEDTLYLEQRRLITEVRCLETFLEESFNEKIQSFPFGTD